MTVQEKIKNYLSDLSPKKVLDLGSGRGRISKIFRNNSSITCVDKKDFSEFLPENFKFIQKDILNFEIKEKFDLIIASMVLHFLKKEDAIKIIENMKENTEKNGYNLILCMSQDEKRSTQNNFYPSIKELNELYKNWKVNSEEFETDLEEHDGFPPHRHKLIILLSQKSL